MIVSLFFALQRVFNGSVNIAGDPLSNLLLLNALSFHHASCLYEDEENLLLWDPVSAIVFWRYLSPEKALPLLKKVPLERPTLCLVGPEMEPLFAPLRKRYACERDTRQWVYLAKEKCPLVLPSGVSFRPAKTSDLPFLIAHYHRDGDEESYLLNCLSRGMILAEKEGKSIGFIGEHPELALGLLYVVAEERGKGVGTALLQSEINAILNQKEHYPMSHIEIHNLASFALHRKAASFTASKVPVRWFF